MAAAAGAPSAWVVLLAASCALRAAAQEAMPGALPAPLPPPDAVLDDANSTAPHARHSREGFDVAMWTAAAAVVGVALAALACVFFRPGGGCCGRRQGLDDDLTGDGAGKQEVLCVGGYVNASTPHAEEGGADIPLIG